MSTTHVQNAGLLSRERTIAGPEYNRWLLPPAALAIHLCIGMVYGLSVFWLPLSQAIGITHPQACPADMGLIGRLTTTACDWKITDISIIFTLGIVFLGASAAIWGSWLERAGPRKAALVAALCWPGGLALGALGVSIHQLWILWLGMGVIGGVGLGLGYISPVSTLIKWFPDRRGMATGMAIMGFGGGAMIGAPLATKLMAHFHTATDVGAASTFLVLAAVYFVFMVGGAFIYRVPADGYVPAGWQPPAHVATASARGSVALENAHRTPQFWLLWAVLCLNVSAGIGVLDMASPMLQEIFGGSLIGAKGVGFTQLTPDQHKLVAAVAGGFAGFLSLFNILGRFFWASISDRIGRRSTYATFFLLGIALYALVPFLARTRRHRPLRPRLRHHPLDVWRRLRDGPRLPRRPLRHRLRRRHTRPPAHRLVSRRRRRTDPGHVPSARRRSTQACRAKTSTTTRCISWQDCSQQASSATSSSALSAPTGSKRAARLRPTGRLLSQ